MVSKVITIREVELNDVPELLEIYNFYVENTAITFEYEKLSETEFENRIGNISHNYPYLVAEAENKIVGYAYASAFHERAAYRWTAEVTVYVKAECKRDGIGRKLYEELERCLKKQNILNLEACIAYPVDGEDEYLTLDSVRFHEKMGYRMVGEFQKCGYKFDRWYSMVWMEKIIGEHHVPNRPFMSYEKVKAEIE